MKLTKTIAALSFAIGLSLYITPSHAGSYAGNGADRHARYNGSAWFLGNEKPIRYCIKRNRNYALDTAQLTETVESAFQVWADYIKAKKIETDLPLNTTLTFQAKCNGTEDLKFYFGVKTLKIEIEKMRYEEPLAFARQTHYDIQRGWSKGFVWASDAVTDVLSLKVLLSHEIGHILGCDHVPGTLMDRDIGNLVLAGSLDLLRLAQIDQSAELWLCDECVLDYHSNSPATSATRAEAFQFLTGKSPKGDITSRLFRGEGFKTPGLLIINDDSKTYAFPFQMNEMLDGSKMNTAIFKISTPEFESYMMPYGRWYSGALNVASGVSLPIIVKLNTSSRAFVYTLAADGTPISLFDTGSLF